jgi:DNA mismatch repair protein MutL
LQRISNLFGKTIQNHLVPVHSISGLVEISGFVGKPDLARNKQNDNYFFVNNRFMKHPYFNKAVVSAFEQLIAKDESPAYFLYFDVKPEEIDINIHPQKTEINFENAQMIYQIIRSAVKEALGKYNVAPSIDFDQEGAFEIPVLKSDTIVKQPQIKINPNYNPFEKTKNSSENNNFLDKNNLGSWEELLKTFETNDKKSSNDQLPIVIENLYSQFIRIRNKYIATSVKSGLMLIEQRRAHVRILYERFREEIKNASVTVQKLLYPFQTELPAEEFSLVCELLSHFQNSGFDLGILGKNKIVVSGVPAFLSEQNPEVLFGKIIEQLRTHEYQPKEGIVDYISEILAEAAAIPHGKKLSDEEINHLTESLFACSSPNFSPSGKTIITIINYEEIDKKFK